MPYDITPVELRVLGALIEKEHTTPDSYPLSLNALTNACNQSSNRDPVMSLDEREVSAAVDELRKRQLVKPIIRSGERATKYAHRLNEELGLVGRQAAVLCVLMLRGPQTAGELRTRTQRMHDFADLEELESTLDGLSAREPEPLVVRLPRRPGQKEQRYAHLLGGPVDVEAFVAEPEPETQPGGRVSLAALQEDVTQLRAELADLRAQLETFRKQFE